MDTASHSCPWHSSLFISLWKRTKAYTSSSAAGLVQIMDRNQTRHCTTGALWSETDPPRQHASLLLVISKSSLWELVLDFKVPHKDQAHDPKSPQHCYNWSLFLRTIECLLWVKLQCSPLTPWGIWIETFDSYFVVLLSFSFEHQASNSVHRTVIKPKVLKLPNSPFTCCKITFKVHSCLRIKPTIPKPPNNHVNVQKMAPTFLSDSTQRSK